MRIINTSEIKKKIIEIIEEISVNISEDALSALQTALKKETNNESAFALESLLKNSVLAKQNNTPVCQDTGMCVVFVELGDKVSLSGCFIGDAIDEGVRIAYKTLRKSVLNPITRENTGDNTPAVIHYKIVEGERVGLSVMLKGFGSENMTKLYMLPPSKGINGIIDSVVDTVKSAGSKPCPPVILGVGIGGTSEKALLMAKEALLRDVCEVNPVERLAALEKICLDKINELDIGAAGMNGITTCIGVNISEYPTHIASIPVAVNVQCHCSRHKTIVI